MSLRNVYSSSFHILTVIYFIPLTLSSLYVVFSSLSHVLLTNVFSVSELYLYLFIVELEAFWFFVYF